MKTSLLLFALILTNVKQTESEAYYPNAYETDCFTDGCLGELVEPNSAYDGNAY